MLHQIWIHIGSSVTRRILVSLPDDGPKSRHILMSLPDDGPMGPTHVAGNKYLIVKY
jgi:hypothetical protein